MSETERWGNARFGKAGFMRGEGGAELFFPSHLVSEVKKEEEQT